MTWMVETVRDGSVDAKSVFGLYAEPSTWSDWGHGASAASTSGPLAEGGSVAVRGKRGWRYQCRITRFVEDRAMELEIKPPFLTVIQTYEVADRPGGARVRHALKISGPLSGILRIGGMVRTYQRLLDAEVEKTIELASLRRPSAT